MYGACITSLFAFVEWERIPLHKSKQRRTRPYRLVIHLSDEEQKMLRVICDAEHGNFSYLVRRLIAQAHRRVNAKGGA